MPPNSSSQDGFGTPDWNAPLDLAEYLAAAPADGTAKGMFFQSYIQQAKAVSNRTPGRDHYAAFRDYPVEEYLKVLYECARLAHPNLPVRQALRLLGQTVYPTLARSMIGKVLFKFAGKNINLALRAVPRAYQVVAPISSAEVETVDCRTAIIKVRNVWDVADATEVGVFEGGLEAFGLTGEVKVRPLSLCDVDLKLTWI